jgi:hypothetical protein
MPGRTSQRIPWQTSHPTVARPAPCPIFARRRARSLGAIRHRWDKARLSHRCGPLRGAADVGGASWPGWSLPCCCMGCWRCIWRFRRANCVTCHHRPSRSCSRAGSPTSRRPSRRRASPRHRPPRPLHRRPRPPRHCRNPSRHRPNRRGQRRPSQRHPSRLRPAPSHPGRSRRFLSLRRLGSPNPCLWSRPRRTNRPPRRCPRHPRRPRPCRQGRQRLPAVPRPPCRPG